MGLFDGKTCVFCGKTSGLLGGLFGYDLAGGAYMCGDCRGKCTPGQNLDFGAMTVEDVKNNMTIAEANKRAGATEFRITRKIQTGAYRDRPFINVDEEHGWFMNAAENDGWVYNLDDIYYFNANVELSPLVEGQTFYLNTYNYPELPTCSDCMKITNVRFKIWLLDNRLGTELIEFSLTPMFEPNESDIRGAYECAHEFFECIKSYRTAQRRHGGRR